MNHEDVLNKLLHHCCGRLTKEEKEAHGGVQEYAIELCCCSFLIRARHLGEGKYQVLEMIVDDPNEQRAAIEGGLESRKDVD